MNVRRWSEPWQFAPASDTPKPDDPLRRVPRGVLMGRRLVEMLLLVVAALLWLAFLCYIAVVWLALLARWAVTGGRT